MNWDQVFEDNGYKPADESRDQVAATLREVLDSFTEVKSIVSPSRVLAYNGHVVSPDVFARWRSVLEQHDAPPDPLRSLGYP